MTRWAPLPVERVQVERQRGDQRLAFARLHLGDAARVQHSAGQHLHVVVALADRAPRGFAHGREGFGQQVVEGLAVAEPVAELGGLVAQRLVGQRLVLGLEGVDLRDQGPQLLDFAFGGVAAESVSQLSMCEQSGPISSPRHAHIVLHRRRSRHFAANGSCAANRYARRVRRTAPRRSRRYGCARSPRPAAATPTAPSYSASACAAADRRVSVTMISSIGELRQPLDARAGQQRVRARRVDRPRARAS